LILATFTPERVPVVTEQPVSVAIAGEGDGQSWNDFVASRPNASGYHSWEWRRVFQRAFGHEPIYLVARLGSDIRGVLPLVQINSVLFGRSLTSLPFLNYGGVVALDEAAAGSLSTAAATVARERRCRHVELRHVARQFPALPCKQHKVTMFLDLAPGMWERLDRKVRNQIRKAQKSGLTSEVGGAELLPDFYAVFARNMRDLGTPVYSRSFFAEVMDAFPERARVHVVRLNRQAVGAGLSFRTGTTIEVPWASSIRDYLALCPNHLLYWGVLEFATEGGCALLDFGRSTPGEGTFKFKEQWGAHPVSLHWEYPWVGGGIPNVHPTNPRFSAAVSVWKKLPLAAATWIGPRLARGIP
jgi:FemAB-related protein (PEP-CTERM system-associated)